MSVVSPSMTAPEEQVEAEVDAVVIAEKPKWPAGSIRDQIVLVRDLLAKADAPKPADALAAAVRRRDPGR